MQTARGELDSTVTVTITGSNDGPMAVVDLAAGMRTATLTIDVLANDTDLDDGHDLHACERLDTTGKGSVTVVADELVFDPGTRFRPPGGRRQRGGHADLHDEDGTGRARLDRDGDDHRQQRRPDGGGRRGGGTRTRR